MKSQISNLKYAAAAFAALSLSAAYTVWFAKPSGPAALVVTPRQYVGLKPAAVTNFTAKLVTINAVETNMSTSGGTTWTCAPSIGTNAGKTICVTGAVDSFGWVQATCSGLATRVYVKVSPDGRWNPAMDCDNDGYADIAEISSNTSPSAITLLDVSCRLR